MPNAANAQSSTCSGGYVSTATSQKQPPPHTHDMKANLRSRITKPFERGEPDKSSAFLNDVGPGVKSSAPGLVGRGYQVTRSEAERCEWEE